MVCLNDQEWCGVVGDRIFRTVQFLSDGDPWNLTGAAVECQVRESWSAAVPLMTATVTEVDAGSGVFTLELDGEEARPVVTGERKWSGVYDVQVTEAGQTRPETVQRGVFTLLPDATRS
jgi:hypothetical protein